MGWDSESAIDIQVSGFCEHGDELSSSVNGEECVYKLRGFHLLKDDSVPWNKLNYLFS
jgi:hypothetical protein